MAKVQFIQLIPDQSTGSIFARDTKGRIWEWHKAPRNRWAILEPPEDRQDGVPELKTLHEAL